MGLHWNEIKSRALLFSKTWDDACNENSLATPFWIDFFEIFGITNKRVATFELMVKKLGGKRGFMDLFWPGVLLVEHKSRGEDLDEALEQAIAYILTARYLKETPNRAAFVSTNSITQGEHVSVLWGEMQRLGMHIHFAHRTFQWSNEAKGNAAVHCVIVGFGAENQAVKTIYEYEDIKGVPLAVHVKNINPYLMDAPTVFLPKRREPICNVPQMTKGSQPTDGGHLLMDDAEKAALLALEPQAAKWIRRFLGAEEFLNSVSRWCLTAAACAVRGSCPRSSGGCRALGPETNRRCPR